MLPPAIIAALVAIVLLVLVGILLAARRGARKAPSPRLNAAFHLPPVTFGVPVQSIYARTVANESLEQRVASL
jgi:ABC-type proline/glycine betaine transport system permease subunit